MNGEPRSFDHFGAEDLTRLAGLAEQDLQSFIARNPHHASLPERILLIALCQGAALHYLDGSNGVKDFDVWSFFADDGSSPRYPVRRRGIARYDGSRFSDSTRRVDLLGRTISGATGADPVAEVQAYLRRPLTASARHLGKKGVVIASPTSLLGTVIWPEHDSARQHRLP